MVDPVKVSTLAVMECVSVCAQAHQQLPLRTHLRSYAVAVSLDQCHDGDLGKFLCKRGKMWRGDIDDEIAVIQCSNEGRSKQARAQTS